MEVMEGVTVITGDFVNVLITTSSAENAPPIERRYRKDITVSDFKTKLELVTGGSAATMKLQVFDAKNRPVCDLTEDGRLLGSYPIDDGMHVHVVDNFTLVGQFGTTDSTERFQLSEEEYQKKGDTLRAFLQKNRLGKYNEEEARAAREQQEAELKEEARLAAAAVVGSRCEVRVPNQPTRRATVMYSGPLDGGKGGIWIGVKYDEPRGKNDGSIDGKRYFTCPPKYGGFVKPVYITVGDFPEEEFDLDDEI